MCYFNFHTVGSSAQPVSTALQQLMDTCPLTTAQVSREIQQEDVSYLAPCFDNVELYVDAMKLTPGEQSNVQLKKIESNHLAMIECLKIWRGKQRSQATFRALLEMLVKLRKGEIADLVCQYLKVSVPLIVVSPNLPNTVSYVGKLCPYHSVYRCMCVRMHSMCVPSILHGVSLSN